MARIRDRDRQGIAECGRGFGERDPMLFEIALGFLRVPFEVHARLARLTITRSAVARKRRPVQRAVMRVPAVPFHPPDTGTSVLRGSQG
jgi:hypothetical protein